MNRAPTAGLAPLYAKFLPEIIEVARTCGYAIGLHGSMSHDLDLIAVPWTHNALPRVELIQRIADLVGGFVDWPGSTTRSPSPETKVHGRVGWCIYFNKRFTGPYIDVSATARVDYETKKIIVDDVGPPL